MRLFHFYLYFLCACCLFVSASVVAVDTPPSFPRGLPVPKNLPGDLTRIQTFLTDSQGAINFLDPETRVLLRMGRSAPLFDGSLISQNLFDAIQRARNEVLALIDSVTAARAGQKMKLALIDEGNKRFKSAPDYLPPKSTITIPSGEPLFNIPGLPSGRSKGFLKDTKPMKQSVTPIVDKLNISADQIEFLYDQFAKINQADINAQKLLRELIVAGVATPDQIKVAKSGGMMTKPQLRAFQQYVEDFTRETLLRPRPFGVESVPVAPLSSAPGSFVSSPEFSQAATPPTTDTSPQRRTLRRYINNPIPPREYTNPNDPFTDPFKNRYGTKFATGRPSAEGLSAVPSGFDEFVKNTEAVRTADTLLAGKAISLDERHMLESSIETLHKSRARFIAAYPEAVKLLGALEAVVPPVKVSPPSVVKPTVTAPKPKLWFRFRR